MGNRDRPHGRGGASGTGPIDGISVLDLGGLGPISRCSVLLRDLGADVVKLFRVAPEEGKDPPFYAYGGFRGMRKLRLDIRHPDGRAAIRRVAGTVDVVLEAFRPGTADRLGVGYDALGRDNERLIYCSLSGYGQSGPYSQWAGHDLNYVAVSGMLATGRRDDQGRPPVPGVTVGDAAGGGMQGAIAVLAALLERERTGRGAHLDVAVTDGVLDLMAFAIDEFLATGEEPSGGDRLTTGRFACYDVYRAGDGRWLSVAAIEPKFFANLCRLLGCEHLIELQYRPDRQDDVRSTLAERFSTKGRDAWVAALAPNDTCVAPVLSVGEASSDPHHRARGRFVHALGPDEVRSFESDTRAVLLAAGCDTIDIDALFDAGLAT